MKKTLLIFLLSLSFQVIQAQTWGATTDTTFFYDWIDDDWLLFRFYAFEYLENGDQVRTRYEVSEEGDTSIFFKNEFFFDEFGNRKTWRSYSFESETGSWVNNTRSEYQHDQLNRPTLSLEEKWDTETQTWLKSRKTSYFDYDEYNNEASWIREIGDENNEWTYNMTTIYERIYENDLLDSLTTHILRVDEVDTLVFSTNKYTYNQQGLKASDTYYRAEPTNNVLELSNEYRYLYNSDNLLHQRFYNVADDNILSPRRSYNYFYDENDPDRLEWYEAIDEQQSSPINDWKIYYKIDDTSTGISSIELNTKINWTMLSPNRLQLEFFSDDFNHQGYTLNLIDAHGQVVKANTIRASQWSQEYNLTSGIYTIILLDWKGSRSIEQVIVP